MIALRYPTPRQVMAPTSFWNARIPTDVIRHPDSAAIVASIRSDVTRRGVYLNTTNAGIEPYVVPAEQPREPVALMRPSKWGTTIPAWAKPLAALLLDPGVPMPSDFLYDPSSDSSMCIYQPDESLTGPDGTVYQGTEWDLWRLKPRDPQQPLPAFTDGSTLPAPAKPVRFTCEMYGRLVGVATSTGRFVDRYTATRRDPVTGLPRNLAERAVFEDDQMGCSASGTPLLPGALTSEDLARGRADHALRLELATINNSAHVWPATRNDGTTTTGPVLEGLRVGMDPDAKLPDTLHPISRVTAVAMQEHGALICDKAPNVAFQADRAAQAFYGGTAAYRIYDGFPWASCYVLAVGSDDTPNVVESA